MTNSRITLEQMARMPFSELADLPPEDLHALLAEAEKQLQQAKMARDWLRGVIDRRRNRKTKLVPAPGGEQ